jgi:hypothetical protein
MFNLIASVGRSPKGHNLTLLMKLHFKGISAYVGSLYHHAMKWISQKNQRLKEVVVVVILKEDGCAV